MSLAKNKQQCYVHYELNGIGITGLDNHALITYFHIKIVIR